MVYISESQVLESRSPWRLSAIPDLFWGILDFIVLFFHTMVSPGLTKKGTGYTSDYRSGNDRWGPPKPPRRRMGGFGGRGGGPTPPPPAGGG